MVGGVGGLIAAFQLTVDKYRLAEDPDFIPSCSINPILSCLDIMKSDQAEAFGFPNPIMGLVGFGMVIAVGAMIIAKFKGGSKTFWRLFHLGTLFGIIFIHWLIYTSLYVVNALCLWCMLAWASTAPIFLYTTIYNLKSNVYPKASKKLVDFLYKNHLSILVLWYLIVIILIVTSFDDYFRTLPPFSWF